MEHRALFMALIDDALEPVESEEVLGHIASCAECREEYETLRETGEFLFAVGDAFRERWPKVEVSESIQAELESKSLVSDIADGREGRGVGAWLPYAVLAAAACLLLAFWLMDGKFGGGQQDLPGVEIAEEKTSESLDAYEEQPSEAVSPNTALDQPGELALNAQEPGADTEVPLEQEGVEAGDKPLSMEDVLALFRESGMDSDAMSKLMQLAKLDLEKAEEIIASKTSSINAKIGAIGSLPPEKVSGALAKIASLSSGNAYVQFLRAGSSLGNTEDALNELLLLEQLDPENALPYYMEALKFLQSEPPDLAAALEALSGAGGLTDAHGYGIEASGYMLDALVEGGMDSDAAATLLATTIGQDESAFLLELGNNLLDHAAQYIDAGDYQTAEQIIRSVQTLGQQIVNGSGLSQGSLAGVDLQLRAMQMLRDIIILQGSAEEAQTLAEEILELIRDMDSLSEMMDAIQDMFENESLENIIAAVMQILSNGDISLFDMLP